MARINRWYDDEERGTGLLLGVLTVIGTLISDLLLMWIEPRIRLQGRA